MARRKVPGPPRCDVLSPTGLSKTFEGPPDCVESRASCTLHPADELGDVFGDCAVATHVRRRPWNRGDESGHVGGVELLQGSHQ